MKFLVLFIEEIIQYSRTSTPTTSPNAMKPKPMLWSCHTSCIEGKKNDNKIGVEQFEHSYQYYTLPFTIVLGYL